MLLSGGIFKFPCEVSCTAIAGAGAAGAGAASAGAAAAAAAAAAVGAAAAGAADGGGRAVVVMAIGCSTNPNCPL